MVHAKELKQRAWNPETKQHIMLETPELIKYHEKDGYVLQVRNEAGDWENAPSSP